MARLNTRPLLAGAVIGGVAAIAIILLPGTALESIVSRIYIGQFLEAAQPPLGFKARLLLAAIPLGIMTVVGLIIGIVMGRRRPAEDDYGSYPVYDLGAPPAADPFARDELVHVPSPPPVEAVEAPAPAAVEPEPEPVRAPVAAAAAKQPAVAAPLDTATAADLAEIADAIVRLGARVDAIEARLDAAPTDTSSGIVPAGLAERLQKIARALDDAG